jgi:hypothetical protein
MQKDNDSSNRGITTSVEMVDVPPPPLVADDEGILKSDNIQTIYYNT